MKDRRRTCFHLEWDQEETGGGGGGGGVSSLKKFQREANNGNGNKEVATTVWLIVAG